jgi:hypothetical protein
MNFKEFEDGLQVEIEFSEKVPKSLMRHLPALHQISVVNLTLLYNDLRSVIPAPYQVRGKLQ